ncbi:TKL protein kinase [Phytophthora nicotianae INRA-310]|uniref:TKL protein kinase n=1 Tax=Phytophthora nicotianae (strain INRA-310) TaxID=761204 RepID=W2R925_PHYN3|nr:TKL protein kinase [Phytophthora nicotianae INRA-310]ETN21908.1 TKL protein kinase [Phytophthora nicotianae INRA-310]
MADQSELHHVRVPQPNDIPAYSSQLLRSNVVYRWGLHYDPTHSTERSFVDGAEPAWVTTWLKDEFAVEGFEELLLIPVILVVVAAMGIGWFCWKRSSLLKREQASSCDFDVVLQITWMSLLTNKLFDGRQHLHGNRIPYDSLVFQTELSKGAPGEVWICRYGGQEVAVKKLLHIRDQKAEDVQIFAEEIELTASLIHPHIVKFIGVAWNSLSNLSMVLEYVPRGNLRDYLHTNSDILSWARDRIFMAIAVAEALENLHSRTPAIIRRDLKSNYILLTKSLDPKLIDFGVSRGMMDLTMTAGVSELDTGRIPHFDAVEDDGTRLVPFQILQEIMTGTLRPSFSVDCPPRIQMLRRSMFVVRTFGSTDG